MIGGKQEELVFRDMKGKLGLCLVPSTRLRKTTQAVARV